MFQFAKDLNLDLGIEEVYKQLCKKYHFQISSKLVMSEIQESARGFITTKWESTTVFQIIKNSI